MDFKARLMIARANCLNVLQGWCNFLKSPLNMPSWSKRQLQIQSLSHFVQVIITSMSWVLCCIPTTWAAKCWSCSFSPSGDE